MAEDSNMGIEAKSVLCEGVQSWYDLISAPPRNPLDIIVSAKIQSGAGQDTGVYLNSTTFNFAPVGWTSGTMPIAGAPVCQALETDNNQRVADAAMWNFSHLTWDSDPTLSPPLQNLLFLRGGEQWQMAIPLNLGALEFSDFELSFLDNAATRGDCQGTIPVISFTARTYTGGIFFLITFKPVTGLFRIGIRAVGGPHGFPPSWYMWEAGWVLVS